VQYLKRPDVIKLDFGIHHKGFLVDSAFTFTWDDDHRGLLESIQDATYSAIKFAG